LDSNVKVAAAISSETSTLKIARAAPAMVSVFPRAVSNSDRLDSVSMSVLKVTKAFNFSKEGAAI
jgi:hypothetical protein